MIQCINFFCGYLNDNSIKPLCVILPQVNGYIKYFDDGGKNMSFAVCYRL